MKEILCAYGVDVDAVSGWIGTYGGADSPSDISRGMFAGEIGTPRLLHLFAKHQIRTTWFVPGHSIDTFPVQMHAVADAGHEIGLHGYSHENPMSMTVDQETDVLQRSIELVGRLTGQPPSGYAAPWWEVGEHTVRLLLANGIDYDHSMMHNDFHPYYLRAGDSWTKVDLSKPASEWMKPLVRGEATTLVEIPASWYLDDLPPMMFIKAAPNSHGFVSVRALEEQWRDQFDWVYDHFDYAVFPMTIHPDVSGRPHVLAMHERLIGYITSRPGTRFCTFEEIARDFIENR